MSDDTPKKRGPLLIEIEPEATPDRPTTRPYLQADAPEPPPSGDARDRRAPRDPNAAPPSPADAPAIDEGFTPSVQQGRTMRAVQRLIGGGRPSRTTRFFINTGVTLFTFLLSVAALRFISNLLVTYPLLGWIGIALFAAFAIAALAMAFREWRAWRRFAAIDHIRVEAVGAMNSGDLRVAKKVTHQLQSLYASRPELAAGRRHLKDHQDEPLDAETLLSMAEADLLAELDQQARREIEAAARTVAAATALIPLALADVIAALAANLRMIRRMAEIYGGRAGAVGGWRLAKTVMAHLVATGAVAAGDDLIHTVAGGGLLAKVSKRFGEGVVNGALTARVGIAAMEVCRPLPFIHQRRPSVGNLIGRGLRGLFSDDEGVKTRRLDSES